MDLRALVQEYFDSCKVMQLATVSHGKPWLCTVYFVTDKDFKIYWTSAKSRQHSRELIADNRAAIAIVKDNDRKQGLQITGKASIVHRDEVERVNKIYGGKFGDKPERLAEVKANDPNGRAYWVFEPDIISLWDEVNFPDNPKQQLRVGNY
jgi:uncharacterized protein YhbP (UPF0306 family)